MMLELLLTWLPPVMHIIAIANLKRGWKWASWFGLVIWATGWLMIFYINLACLLALLFYVALFVTYGITRAATGKPPVQT